MEAPIALIYDSRIRAINSSGALIVGATLTVYDAGTTTPSSIYRDAALTTPMTNPTSGSDVSDSGGWFPQIFAAEGALFDITLKTSGGVVVKAYVSVPALGTGGANITRDYGASRLLIRGAGGRVYFEGGDASGDDAGGKVTIGGYSGTQADDMVLNSAAVTIGGTVNTGSTLTENAKSLLGVAQDVATFSAVASVAIPLTNSPTGIRAWDIDVIDFSPSANSTVITAQFSFDSGATYASAAAYDYSWSYPSGANTMGAAIATGATSILLVPVADILASSLRLRAVTTNTTGRTMLFGTAMMGGVGGAPRLYHTGGVYQTVSARATHVKLIASAGTISGAYRVSPQRGF